MSADAKYDIGAIEIDQLTDTQPSLESEKQDGAIPPTEEGGQKGILHGLQPSIQGGADYLCGLAARRPSAAVRHPYNDRRHHRSVLRRPHHGDVRQVRRWLVLVLSPAWLCADRIFEWPLRAMQRIDTR
jgi:hypothetical protein